MQNLTGAGGRAQQHSSAFRALVGAPCLAAPSLILPISSLAQFLVGSHDAATLFEKPYYLLVRLFFGLLIYIYLLIKEVILGDARSLLGSNQPVLYILYMLYKQSKVFKPKCLRGEGRPATGLPGIPWSECGHGDGTWPKNGAVHPEMQGHIQSHGEATIPSPLEPNHPMAIEPALCFLCRLKPSETVVAASRNCAEFIYFYICGVSQFIESSEQVPL